MGNCVSVQLGLDQLFTCCAAGAAEEVMYIWQLKDNLEDLKTSRAQLKASMQDLKQRLQNQEGPQMKRLQVVDLWFTSVDQKLTEADKLITAAQVEIDEKSCCGGCCYKNSIATYALGKKIVAAKLQLNEEIQNGKFESLVERIPDEPDYIRKLKIDLKDLRIARNELEATKDDLVRRVNSEEGGKMKLLERVRVWISEAEKLITEVDPLLMVVPEEIEKWQVRDFSNSGVGETVAERLKDVKKLIKEGKFPVVVESVESEYRSKVEDDMKELKRFRRELSGLASDVMGRVIYEEEREQRNRLKQVQVWHENALTTIVAADELLHKDAAEIEKLTHGCSSSSFGKRLGNMLKDVVYQIKKGEFSEVTTAAPPEPVVEIDCDQIGETVGLQTKLDEAWRVLMKPEVGILGLYGLGGVGKTTLLTHINNKFLHTPSDFDYVIWIVVSKDFTLSKVQEEIGERIGIAVNDWKKKEIGEKSKDIRNLLRKKKFVLLLDDLWEKVHLEKAGVPIPRRQNGSKIVLTTRSELVCSLMDAKKRIKVEKLPPDQAWQLFEEKLGRDTLSADPDIRPIAESVAKECDGLPLALIVVARAMACSKTAKEWRYALSDLQQSASDLQGIKDEVFARLKLSYDRLPDDKYRSCFIYCALFPEDYKINKDDLVDYWISEKFESDNEGEHITRAKAHHIVRDLVNVCLLEEEGKFVKLHDMIRDMALWISCDLDKKKYNFLVQAGKQLNKAPDVVKWEGVRRASLMENSIRNLPEVSVCRDLRTLLLCRNPRLYEINGSIFKHSSALTVLDLSNTRIHVLPMGVTELFCLQYLNLSRTWIQQLPPELKRLRKLIYLNLEHNDLLGMIPKGVISSFLSLQVLRMFRSGFFYGGEDDNILSDSKVHIEEIQHLKHLNVVSITIRSSDALVLYFNTENVQSCTQSLSLECLGSPKSKSIEFAPTEDMDQLETLQISASEHLEQINLSPKFRFSSLREVVVEYCPRLLNLNWLVRAPNLAVLRVAVCEKMVEISDNAMTFTKLEVLELEGLPQLKNICCKASSLPCIKRIRVLDCPLLKKVPLNSEILKVRKIVIEAEDQWWKELEKKDQGIKDAFQSCFRSYPPRTRICRAPHHYFDIWNSIYS
ncbi:probable disease resistance protein At5g63020 [Euphorbia lathyris]|uniref:probable disease resistance protein At5g63020 n=1 Tax=Euphorbia lathyris TaxID=212925 RepID=UPI003313D902